jgi:hypothetical protein
MQAIRERIAKQLQESGSYCAEEKRLRSFYKKIKRSLDFLPAVAQAITAAGRFATF